LSKGCRYRDKAFGQRAIDDARLCSGRGHQISKRRFRRIALAIDTVKDGEPAAPWRRPR